MVLVDSDAPEDFPEELGSLFIWLTAEDELRGRVRPVYQAPPKGTLGGPSAGELIVSLGRDGAVVLATALVTWVRYRTHNLRLRVTDKHGREIEVSAKRVRGADAAEVRHLIDRLSVLGGEDDDTDTGGPSAP
ncbi:hypothetical protein [Streptomyces sp. NPDC001678]|uniref:effector-associated constant component EACC1 n=1 Tax=Streptomyces sp. NPDC001678 TaxID=3364599 RepID=UPI0036D0D1CB